MLVIVKGEGTRKFPYTQDKLYKEAADEDASAASDSPEGRGILARAVRIMISRHGTAATTRWEKN